MPLDKSPLRKWRISVGMTQKRLADLAGISQSHISQVENGLVEIEGNLKRYLESIARLHEKQRIFRIKRKESLDAFYDYERKEHTNIADEA